jgi:hypothetical protein
MQIDRLRIAPEVTETALASAASLSDCLVDLLNGSGVLGNNLLFLIVGKLIDDTAAGAREGEPV